MRTKRCQPTFPGVVLLVAAVASCAAPDDSGLPGDLSDAGHPGDAGAGNLAEVGPLRLWRRLSREEIEPTVQHLQGGVGTPDLAETGFPLDETLGGFDTDPALLQFSSAHLDAMERFAADLSRSVLESDAVRTLGGEGCRPELTERECVRAALSGAATLLLRRPPSEFAIDRWVALSPASARPVEVIARAIRDMVLSPAFLYVFEKTEPGPDGRERLDLPSRMARMTFVVWGAAPDKALWQMAALGLFDGPGGDARLAREVINAPEASAFGRRFVVRWLHLDRALHNNIPLFVALSRSAQGQVERLVEEWSRSGTVDDLLTSRVVWVDAVLAPKFGLTPPSGDGWLRAELTPESGRSGVLTLPSLLAATHLESGLATRRGAWVQSVLLCEPEPVPPPVATPMLPPAGQPVDGPSEALQQAVSAPGCVVCHGPLDGAGRALAGFDLDGTRRSERVVAAELSLSDGRRWPLSGAADLARAVLDSGRFEPCLSRQLARFAVGIEDPALEPMAAELTALLSGERRLMALVEAMIASPSFLSVPAPGATP